MSIERYDELVIGFVVNAEDILRPFAVKLPEVSHMEERFDSKSGKKLAPVKIVDVEEHTVYEVDGERYEDLEAVMDRLCKRCGGLWATIQHGDYEGDSVISIEPKYKMKDGVLPLTAVAKLAKDALKIRANFKKLYGIKLEEPGIQTVETWG